MTAVIPMTTKVNTHEAKTQLSKLLVRVEAGEEIIIARAGTPVARLVPIEPLITDRRPGTAAGQIVVADDFDAPLSDDVLKGFEG
jgi:prevent-host-death family protein